MITESKTRVTSLVAERGLGPLPEIVVDELVAIYVRRTEIAQKRAINQIVTAESVARIFKSKLGSKKKTAKTIAKKPAASAS